MDINGKKISKQKCPNGPPCQAKMDIKEALDGLTKRGILQKGNRMAIEALLNPEHELHVINDATEEEICCAVLNAQEVLNNASLMPSTTGDESNDKGPSHLEFLHASSIVNKFISKVNDPSAHKLEATLSLFSNHICVEQSQSLTSTKITQYFNHK